MKVKLSRFKYLINHSIARFIIFAIIISGISYFFMAYGESTVIKAEETGISQNIQWDSTSDSINLSVLVSPEYKKYEIYYTNGMPPEITFVTPDGTKQASAKDDIQCDVVSLHRNPNLNVDDYPDFSMESIYIKSDTEPGAWTMHIQKNTGCRDILVVEAEVEDGWENLKCDYATQPVLFICRYTGGGSFVTNEDISNIIKKGNVPEINNIHSETVKKDEIETTGQSVIDWIMSLIPTVLVIGGISGVGFYLYHKQQKKKKLQEEREKRKNAANAKVKEKKMKENDLLDELNNSFNDYDEFDDEFDKDESYEEDEYEEDEAEEHIDMKNEPEKKISKPAIKRQKKLDTQPQSSAVMQQTSLQTHTVPAPAKNVLPQGHPGFVEKQMQKTSYMPGYLPVPQTNQNVVVSDMPQAGGQQIVPQQPVKMNSENPFSHNINTTNIPVGTQQQRVMMPRASFQQPESKFETKVIFPHVEIQEAGDDDYF